MTASADWETLCGVDGAIADVLGRLYDALRAAADGAAAIHVARRRDDATARTHEDLATIATQCRQGVKPPTVDPHGSLADVGGRRLSVKRGV
jgi:hypothetical protein